MKPLVSIIIAVCNGEKFISETLDSLVHQTINNWECWIVDDGSTDLTIEIARNRCAIDARFNLLTTPGVMALILLLTKPYRFAKLTL